MNKHMLMQEARRIEMDVQEARRRVQRATSIAEVVRAMNVQVRAPFRSLRHLFPGLRSLPAFAERRAEEILRGQVRGLADCADEASRTTQRVALLAGDWRLLAGRFPRLARLAEIENRKLQDFRLPLLVAPRREPSGEMSVENVRLLGRLI